MLKETFSNLIGHAIVAAGRSIKVHNLSMYAKYGFDITPEQYLILNILSDDRDLSQVKLGELLYKDKSNVARLISILEEKGLVNKVQKIDNKKQVNIIKITEKGKELRNKITPHMQKSREYYLKDISDDEMYACIKVLDKIQKNLEKD